MLTLFQEKKVLPFNLAVKHFKRLKLLIVPAMWQTIGLRPKRTVMLRKRFITRLPKLKDAG